MTTITSITMTARIGYRNPYGDPEPSRNAQTSLFMGAPSDAKHAKFYVTPGLTHNHPAGVYALSVSNFGTVYHCHWDGNTISSESKIEEYFPILSKGQNVICSWTTDRDIHFSITIVFKE